MVETSSSLTQAIENVMQVFLAGIHTCLPGQIESYDFRTSKVSVKPLIKKKFLDGTILEIPIIENVPVVFPRTSRSGTTFPLKKGDKCLIVFSQRAMERYLSSGEDSEPGDKRKFDLTDAIAIPGLFSFVEGSIASNNDDMEISHEGQKVTIKKNGDIQIGSSSLKKLVTEEFKDVFNNHVHNFTAAPSGVFSTSTPANLLTGVPGTPAGSIAATFINALGDSHVTSKVKGQ
jgi:hypothetical protein